MVQLNTRDAVRTRITAAVPGLQRVYLPGTEEPDPANPRANATPYAILRWEDVTPYSSGQELQIASVDFYVRPWATRNELDRLMRDLKVGLLNRVIVGEDQAWYVVSIGETSDFPDQAMEVIGRGARINARRTR